MKTNSSNKENQRQNLEQKNFEKNTVTETPSTDEKEYSTLPAQGSSPLAVGRRRWRQAAAKMGTSAMDSRKRAV
jgi:hypothetical protein